MQRPQKQEKDIEYLMGLTYLDPADPKAIKALRNLYDAVKNVNLKEFSLDKPIPTVDGDKRLCVILLGNRIKDIRHIMENVDLSAPAEDAEKFAAMTHLYGERVNRDTENEFKAALRTQIKIEWQSDNQSQTEDQVTAEVERRFNLPKNQQRIEEMKTDKLLAIGRANEGAVNLRVKENRLVYAFNILMNRPASPADAPNPDRRPEPGTSLRQLVADTVRTSVLKLEDAEHAAQAKFIKLQLTSNKSSVIKELQRHASEMLTALKEPDSEIQLAAMRATEKYARKVKSAPVTLTAEAVELGAEDQRIKALLTTPFGLVKDDKYFQELHGLLGLTPKECAKLMAIDTDKPAMKALYSVLNGLQKYGAQANSDSRAGLMLRRIPFENEVKEKNLGQLSFYQLYVAALQEGIDVQRRNKNPGGDIKTGLQLFSFSAEQKKYRMTKSKTLNALFTNAPRLEQIMERLLTAENPHLIDEARITAGLDPKAKSAPNLGRKK